MMVNAASRAALASLRQQLNEMLPSLGNDAGRYETLASELYSAASLLSAQPRLRRTLGDASTDASGRAELARALLAGKLGGEAVTLVSDAAGLRWSSPWDLADGLEMMADEALLSAAEQQGQLDTIEDELFRFERIVSAAGDLEATFDEVAVAVQRRLDLLHSLIDGKVSPITAELLAHAVASGRKRSVLLAIDDLLQSSAARRDRSVARVTSATELTEQQTGRLAAALSRIYGRQISIRTAVDESVRGGLVVRIGDEVIDGTVATKLAAARAAFAGR